MSATTHRTNDSPSATRWRFWIDGCGGYLVLTGDRWTLGGPTQGGPTSGEGADIRVRADLGRCAGTIEYRGGDYFWRAGQGTDRGELISDGRLLSLIGSARLTLHMPSPLSASAVLTVRPPHRFDQHVDAVVLAQETVLVGASRDCHLRFRDLADRAILMLQADRWMAKLGSSGESVELLPGRRTFLQSLAITLEPA